MAQEHEAGLVICVTGPESTGKTTLASSLARALGAPLVDEVAREWLTVHMREPHAQHALDPSERVAPQRYDRADVLEIARAQYAAEAAAVGTGAPVVVADTDLTVIRIWWEERFGPVDPWIAGALRDLRPRRYLLTLPDIPWEPDPLRESPHERERLLVRYRSLLGELGFPHVEIGGSGPVRHERAFAAVSRWLRDLANPAAGDRVP